MDLEVSPTGEDLSWEVGRPEGVGEVGVRGQGTTGGDEEEVNDEDPKTTEVVEEPEKNEVPWGRGRQETGVGETEGVGEQRHVEG